MYLEFINQGKPSIYKTWRSIWFIYTYINRILYMKGRAIRYTLERSILHKIPDNRALELTWLLEEEEGRPEDEDDEGRIRPEDGLPFPCLNRLREEEGRDLNFLIIFFFWKWCNIQNIIIIIMPFDLYLKSNFSLYIQTQGCSRFCS